MKSRGGGWSSETGRGIDSLRQKRERDRETTTEPKRSGEVSKETLALATDSVTIPSAGASAEAPQRSARGCPGRQGLQGAVASPHLPLLAAPPHLAQGGRNGVGARGLFGAVEWKIDFNPLCGDRGARSALPDRGSRRSGGPLPRPGLESLQSHAARGTPGLGVPTGLAGSAHPAAGGRP